MDLETQFTAKMWKTTMNGAWYFVSLPIETSAWIKSFQARRLGFGSVKVNVRIGATSWKTSIFPDSKLGTYVLPIKKQARQSEAIEEGDEVAVYLGFQPE